MPDSPPATFTIRRAEPNDAESLAALAAHTFEAAFGADNNPEDLAAHLAASFSPEKQAAEIADPSRVVLVAEADDILVGYVMLRWGESPESVDGARPIELQRIYVLGEWQSQRLGGALMERALAEARAAGADSIWLSVWQPNSRAQAFYERWGFAIVGTKFFMVGTDNQSDYVMARGLVE